MIRIRGLDHVVLRTRDLEAMLAYYCEVLVVWSSASWAPNSG